MPPLVDAPSDYGRVPVEDPALHAPAGLQPLVDVWMRDPHICLAGDGRYYLSGTTRSPRNPDENCRRWNDGIELWSSEDLSTWHHHGLVWSLDRDATWQRFFHVPNVGGTHTTSSNQPVPQASGGGRLVAPEDLDLASLPPDLAVRRSLWGPSLHYLPRRRTYLLGGCMNYGMGVDPGQWALPQFGGTFLLRSDSPAGPYEPLHPDHPLTDMIDEHPLEDEDGTVWMVYMDGRLVRLSDDLRQVKEIIHPWQKIYGRSTGNGGEGASIFKHDGRYHLTLAINSRQLNDGSVRYPSDLGIQGEGQRYSYDLVMASSDNIRGPYGWRYTALIGGGHGHVLQDKQGLRWVVCFGNPFADRATVGPEPCRPYLVPMAWQGDRLLPDHDSARQRLL